MTVRDQEENKNSKKPKKKRILYALIVIVVIGLHASTRMHHNLPLKLVSLIDYIKLYLNEADKK